jgi:hypothetical protein
MPPLDEEPRGREIRRHPRQLVLHQLELGERHQTAAGARGERLVEGAGGHAAGGGARTVARSRRAS